MLAPGFPRGIRACAALTLVALMTLSACGAKRHTVSASAQPVYDLATESPYGLAAQWQGGPAAAPMEASRTAPAEKTLAYEHTISVELPKQAIAERLKALEAACAKAADEGCAVLNVSMQAHNAVPSGSIQVRLAAGGVDTFIELAAQSGKVISRSTQAEDLAQPVADTERELALLKMHRDRLEAFQKSGDLKIEQLITVSKELATVQAQIDTLDTTRANLRRRIDTQLLTIRLAPPDEELLGADTPVKDAVQQFGNTFATGVGTVISFIAVLIPWLVIIVPGLILIRVFWRWIGRWLSRREVARQR